jgi:hypothetical protein
MEDYNVPYSSGNDPEPLRKGVGYDVTTYAGKYNGKDGDKLVFIDAKGVVSKYPTEVVRSGYVRFTKGSRSNNNNYYAAKKAPGMHILKGRFLERAMTVSPTRKNNSNSKRSKTRSNNKSVVSYNPMFKSRN